MSAIETNWHANYLLSCRVDHRCCDEPMTCDDVPANPLTSHVPAEAADL